jgi:hypothetical protein
MVFNPGERMLLLPSPLVMVAGALIGMDALYIAATLTGALCVYALARRLNVPHGSALMTAGVYALAYPLSIGSGTAMPVTAALVMGTVTLVSADRWRWGGLASGAAVFAHPLAGIAALVIMIGAAQRGRLMRAVLPFALAVSVGVALLLTYFGVDGLAGLLVHHPLQPIDRGTLELGQFTLGLPLVPVLAAAAWAWLRADQRSQLIPAWCGLMVLFTSLVLISRGEYGVWSYATLTGPLLLLIVQRWHGTRYTLLAVLAAAVMPFVAIFMAGAVRDESHDEWLRPYLDSAQTLGITTLSRSVDVPWQVTQSIVAFDGQLSPALSAFLERDDLYSATVALAPDILIADTSEGRVIFPGDPDARQALGYQPINSLPMLLRRSVPIGAFSTSPLSASYGPDLLLRSYAVDAESVSAGDVFRLRLDWRVSRPAPDDLTVDIALTDSTREFGRISQTLSYRLFRAGEYSTYHVIRLDPDSTAGSADLRLTVWSNDGRLGDHRLGILTVR